MEKDFCAEWLNQLLMSLENGCDDKQCLFDQCANYHYQCNHMDDILEKYIGNLQGFLSFLEDAWGWKITISQDGNTILVDENKDYCVCPIAAKIEGEVSPLLCNCSVRFAQKMFSKVCQKEVTAKVNRSFLRDGKSCIYEITIN